MKKGLVTAVFAAITSTLTAHANAHADSGAKLLSFETVYEGDRAVMLPTVKNANGTVCKSYIAAVERTEDGRIDATVRQICGEPSLIGAAPANLESLEKFETSGMVIQLPTVRVSQQ